VKHFDSVSQLTIAQIQAAVCSEWQIDAHEMRSFRRGKDVSLARQTAIYLARELTLLSYPGIARAFGRADHTSILWAVNRVSQRMVDDPAYAVRVIALRNQLDAQELVEEF